MKKFTISYQKANSDDLNFLLQLREQTMTEHLISSGMEITTENFLKRIHHNFEDAKLILLDAKPIGLLKVSENENIVEIVQIQISPGYQGNGIGKQIVNDIINDAFLKKQSVTLSVLKNNKAKNLYEALGFVIIDEDDHSYIMKI